MSQLLPDFPIHHAGIKPVTHPRLNVQTNRQIAVRYLRFGRRVRIERLELPLKVYGRWVPRVPCHPAHLIISVLDPATHQWIVLKEVDLPPNPLISGAGLTQRMTAEEMEQRLSQALQAPPHVIQIKRLITDHLKVECDREHPTWPSHGETNGGEFNVPFGILHSLRAYGKELDAPVAFKYSPCLKLRDFKPRAPRGMTLRQLPHMLLFEGPRISAGFSLRRPILLHLGWDTFSSGAASRNRILDTQALGRSSNIGGLSGPTLRTTSLDILPHHWTGDVSVEGNRVIYQNLRCSEPGIRLNASFTVQADRLLMDVNLRSTQAIHAIESHVWRLVWDGRAAMTGAAALPTLRAGRNGNVALPMLWAGDGVGALSCRVLANSPDPLHMDVESYRSQRCVAGGFAFQNDGIARGTRSASVELAVTRFEPLTNRQSKPGVRAHWGSIYSCFRPELGGFSNNAISCNCHVNQHCPTELVTFTRKPTHGPNPVALYRFTIERALLGGGGYGFWQHLYLDSAPILISGAGRIHQAEPNLIWLRRIEPAIIEVTRSLLQTLGNDGMAVCRTLSGNSGSYRWSSNAYDVVGFGHIDGYVNAWTYRALRNAAAMLEDLGNRDLSKQCRDRSRELRDEYAKSLLNPRTNWIAGWRSRDGELHDYAFTWVNAVACAFGLLDLPTARRAMLGLEQLRKDQGVSSGTFGVPANLLPIRREDHMLPKVQPFFPSAPTFEFYTDGAMNALFSGYYIRALATSGLKSQARQLARDMDEGYAAGVWNGGFGSGVEFRSWDGLPTGYEGTFVGNFGALYAIAIEQGLFQPFDPEWWPVNG